MIWRPSPFDTFPCKSIKWLSDGCESPDESTIKVAKTQKRTNVLDLVWRGPVFDGCDFDRVHRCHPLFKDYPQVINARGVEDAFFWFEVEVVVSGKLENVRDGCVMISVTSTGGNSDVVHINTDRSAEEFMFSNN